MNINELKNSAVDITPTEEIQTKETYEPTPEEKEKTEKFLRSALIKKHGWILKNIYDRMHKTHYTIDQLKEEIQQKQSPFSLSQRNFILGFKTDFIQDLLKDIYNKKDLYEINLT